MPSSSPCPTDSSLQTVPVDVTALYQKHAVMMLRTAFRITHDMSDAEDVLHNVFARMIQRTEPVPDEKNAGPYLHRAAINQALNLMRAKHRLASRARGESAIASDHADPDAIHQQNESVRRLSAALALLPPRWAEIIVLRYMEGLSNKAIASMLNTSWSVIAVTLHRARHQLRLELQAISGERS